MKDFLAFLYLKYNLISTLKKLSGLIPGTKLFFNRLCVIKLVCGPVEAQGKELFLLYNSIIDWGRLQVGSPAPKCESRLFYVKTIPKNTSFFFVKVVRITH